MPGTSARVGVVSVVVALGGACGGATDTLGGPSDGGALSSACPGAVPASGSACAVALECEYGSDPDVSCDAVATCTAGHWQVKPAPGTPCSTTLSSACPANFASLGKTCTEGLECVYPQARCTCATHCDLVGMSAPFWCCPDAPSSTPGCPSPRPRIGSSCDVDAGYCDYGGCTGNVVLVCTGGTWQPTTMFGCPG